MVNEREGQITIQIIKHGDTTETLTVMFQTLSGTASLGKSDEIAMKPSGDNNVMQGLVLEPQKLWKYVGGCLSLNANTLPDEVSFGLQV